MDLGSGIGDRPGGVGSWDRAEDVGLVRLIEWWLDIAELDAKSCSAKAEEYGSVDLELLGDATARLIGWTDAPDRIKIELGIAWYLQGKIARMFGAYAARQIPSDDTVADIRRYAMMLTRVRDGGRWP